MAAIQIALIAITLGTGAADTVNADDVEAQLTKTIAAFDEAFAKEFGTEGIVAKAKAAVEHLDVDRLSGVQLGRLLGHPAMLSYAGLTETVRSRLEGCAEDNGPDGATAAVHLFNARRKQLPTIDAKVKLYRDTFGRRGLEEAASRGAIDHVFHIADPDDPELLDAVFDEFLALQRLVDQRAAPQLACNFSVYFDALLQARRRGKSVDAEALRLKMLEVARATRGRQSRPDLEDMLERTIAFLEGAYARGTLIGHPAQALKVLWSSDGSTNSLEQLKGKIVVLDFWATWCGPCVSSIPHVRALQDRLPKESVQIIGVAQVEGAHVRPDGTSIDTSGTPQREFELMAEYVQQQNITWPIVFAPGAREEYGVLGIPHMVVIDREGVVRLRDLHPSESLDSLAKKIEALAGSGPNERADKP